MSISFSPKRETISWLNVEIEVIKQGSILGDWTWKSAKLQSQMSKALFKSLGPRFDRTAHSSMGWE